MPTSRLVDGPCREGTRKSPSILIPSVVRIDARKRPTSKIRVETYYCGVIRPDDSRGHAGGYSGHVSLRAFQNELRGVGAFFISVSPAETYLDRRSRKSHRQSHRAVRTRRTGRPRGGRSGLRRIWQPHCVQHFYDIRPTRPWIATLGSHRFAMARHEHICRTRSAPFAGTCMSGASPSYTSHGAHTRYTHV